jgi:anti-anti-sigma factor
MNRSTTPLIEPPDLPIIFTNGPVELVRGNEQPLVDELSTLLARHNVALDLSATERIDAAGIAALIRIYRIAQENGHSFQVTRTSRHVNELLKIVGLEGVLLSRIVSNAPHSGPFSNADAA